MKFRWTSDVTTVIYGSLCDSGRSLRDSLELAITNLYKPPMDTAVIGNAFHVWVELPGVLSEDIDVYIREDVLIIEGYKRSFYPSDVPVVFNIVERCSAPFRRALKIPQAIDISSIESDFSGGILYIFWKCLP